MNSESGQVNIKPGKRVKSNNARCIYCRKCYNTGLCMMRWPGFPVPGFEESTNIGIGSQKKVKRDG